MRFLLLTIPVAALTFIVQGPAGNRPDPRPATKDLASNHARIAIRTPLEANSAFVQELMIETSEPADVEVIFARRHDASGSFYQTVRRPGQVRANGRLVLFLDYLRGGKDDSFIKQPCLRWAWSWLKGDEDLKSGASQNPPVAMPDAKTLDDILTQKVQPGDYPYTGRDGSGKEALEVLSVGGCRVLLRISEPKPKE